MKLNASRFLFAWISMLSAGMASATDYNADFYGVACNNHDGVAVEFAHNSQFVATDNYFLSIHNGQQFGTSQWNFEQNGGDVGVSNPKISWTAKNMQQIQAGDSVHLGFSTDVPQMYAKSVAWLIKLPNTTPPGFGEDDSGCSPVIQIFSLEIHTDGKTLTFINDTNGNRREPLFLSNATVEYYKAHQPLKTLNSYTRRRPLLIDKLEIPPAPVTPGHSINVSYRPPPDAKYAVFVYNTDTCVCSNRPSMSRAWAEFPLIEPKNRKYSSRDRSASQDWRL